MPWWALALVIGAASFGGPARAAIHSRQPSDTSTGNTVYRMTGSRIAIGRDIHVPSDEEVVDAVVVVGGSLRIDGRVREGVIVVGGNLHLGPTADVRGDVALVGGEITREPSARLLGSVSSVSVGAWPDLGSMFGWWRTFPLGEIGRWLGLAATIVRISVLATLVVFILLIARAPVARVGRAAAAEPVRAALVGLAAEVLFLPLLLIVSIALGITIIGLPIVALLVPLAVILACAGLLLGYTALACRIGEWVEDRLGWRPRSAFLAAAIGMALIVGPTLVARMLDVAPAPLHVAALSLLAAGAIAEFLVWTIGFGATLMTGFGRWHTTPPPLESQ